MNAVIYTKDECPFCDSVKMLLNIKKVTFEERKLGKDFVREEFIALFPEQRTFPLVFINDVKIGGFDDTKRYFDSKKST